MKKKEMAEQIIVALNWSKENWNRLLKSQQIHIIEGLKKRYLVCVK